MIIRGRNNEPLNVGRVDRNGNVFNSRGYDTGLKIPVLGSPIVDKRGYEVPGATVDSNGDVRDRNGYFVLGYTRLESE